MNEFERDRVVSLKLIGVWIDNREDPDSTRGYLHPQEIVDKGWRQDERAKIVAYLRKPPVAFHKLHVEHNRFLDCKHNANEPFPNLVEYDPDDDLGTGKQTDGVWIWPEGLATYVERYFVRLPEEFVEHMRERNWDPSIEYDIEQLPSRNVKRSVEFWLDWCAKEKALLDSDD